MHNSDQFICSALGKPFTSNCSWRKATGNHLYPPLLICISQVYDGTSEMAMSSRTCLRAEHCVCVFRPSRSPLRQPRSRTAPGSPMASFQSESSPATAIGSFHRSVGVRCVGSEEQVNRCFFLTTVCSSLFMGGVGWFVILFGLSDCK